MKSAYAGLSRLEANPPESISELRTVEANCAAAYFRSWVGMPIKWRGTSRRPIPDNWRSFGQRSSPYHLAGNRNAAHPVNAILNYAYATLESEIRILAEYGNVVLSCGVGSHVGTRGLPGGAEGIRTFDLRSEAPAVTAPSLPRLNISAPARRQERWGSFALGRRQWKPSGARARWRPGF
jgi:hypothetical protein